MHSYTQPDDGPGWAVRYRSHGGPNGDDRTPDATAARREHLVGEVRKLLADRAALATAIQAAGHRASERWWPDDARLLARSHRGRRSWFRLDPDVLWYCERTGDDHLTWGAERTPALVLALDEILGRMVRLRAECALTGRPWRGLVAAAARTRSDT